MSKISTLFCQFDMEKNTTFIFNLLCVLSSPCLKKDKKTSSGQCGSQVEDIIIALHFCCLYIARIGPSDLTPVLWERVTLTLPGPMGIDHVGNSGSSPQGQ